VPSYGGKIQLKNASSYNIYIIFQTVEYTEKMLCVEKGEEIRITHIFSGDYRKSLANPVNYYTDISLYDFDSGLLLKNLTVNGGTFELKTGSVNSKNALFEFTINDDTFGGN
jgi:hypothetical protein